MVPSLASSWPDSRAACRTAVLLFSIESETRIDDQEAREVLSQYFVRPPLSLEKIHWDEDQDTRSRRRYHKRAHSAGSPYGNVKGNLKFRSVMRRGIGKVCMEVALVFMLHNMLKLTVAEAYG
jgi:hypothetical protein